MNLIKTDKYPSALMLIQMGLYHAYDGVCSLAMHLTTQVWNLFSKVLLNSNHPNGSDSSISPNKLIIKNPLYIKEGDSDEDETCEAIEEEDKPLPFNIAQSRAIAIPKRDAKNTNTEQVERFLKKEQKLKTLLKRPSFEEADIKKISKLINFLADLNFELGSPYGLDVKMSKLWEQINQLRETGLKI